MVSVKDLARLEVERQAIPGGHNGLDFSGHSACAGCGLATAHRITMLALGKDTIQVTPACCTSIVQSPFPKSSFNLPLLNIAFAAAASAASGVSQALDAQGRNNVTVMAWGGDGGTTDIGVASVSGAAERNENMIYICYDNQAYGNTGNQRSSATPPGARTTTTPAGNKSKGKFMPFLLMSHGIPYVAVTSSGYPQDIYEKVLKAKSIKGFKYIQILAHCPTNWRSAVDKGTTLAQLAVETGFWPMFEAENGTKITLTKRFEKYRDPTNRKDLKEFVSAQGRFKGMSDQEYELLKTTIAERWNYITKFI